jgi:trimethylamine--corrinoid protein Co-methyltransferase
MPIGLKFKLLNKETLSRIHDATLGILSETGVVFRSIECLDIFKKHGSTVQGQTVFISKEVVDKAIKSAPETFQLEALNIERSKHVCMEQDGIHVSMNNGPIYVQDLDKGRGLCL